MQLKVCGNGANLKEVADILGHKNIETTENYYISSSEESRKIANELFERSTYSETIEQISKYEINY